MNFSSSISELIKKRTSCRTYTSQLLEDRKEKQVQAYLQKKIVSPFRGETRFIYLKMPELDQKERKKLGTYGFIQGANYFVVGVTKKTQYDLENFGYIMENIILFITDLELATCWVGGTLKRNNFSNHISLNEDEIIAAITPVGYPSEKRGKIDKLVKLAARGKKRLQWELLFFEGNFRNPLTKEKADQYQIPLEMVRLAPSSSNGQPWRIVKEKKQNNFHFYIHRKRFRGKILSKWLDFPRMDLGIAMCHFNLTNEELGLKGTWVFSKPTISKPTNCDYIATWLAD